MGKPGVFHVEHLAQNGIVPRGTFLLLPTTCGLKASVFLAQGNALG